MQTIRLLQDWVVRDLGLDKVVLEVDAVNQRAISLYQRLGFVQVREIWKPEEHPALVAYYSRHEVPPGFRWEGQHLEVLSWVME